MKAITGDMNRSSRLNKLSSSGLCGNPQPFWIDNLGILLVYVVFTCVANIFLIIY